MTSRLSSSVGLPPDPKIALLSPCGWGNLGDAAIVESLIRGIRRRIPSARIVAFTLNPADTTNRHRIEAHTCAGYSLPLYWVKEPADEAVAVGSAPRGTPVGALWWSVAAAVRDILRRVPVRGPFRAWALVPFRLFHERRHLARSRERLTGASMLVVAGGGQLDGVWGGVLGHPYVLWRWARLARSINSSVVFASVGTGGLSTPARWLVLRALGLATYRSYRDERSRQLLRAPALTGKDKIVPDLAYALPVRVTPPPRGERLVVGLSPMAYRHPSLWPRPDLGRYQRHTRSFAGIATRILAEGHEVVLFVTDSDMVAIEDLVGAVGEAASHNRHRLRVAQTRTLDTLLDTLATVDVVVAARLHGVILAHLANRPVLAVSHERKVRTLMEDMAQQRYCVDIEDFAEDVGYRLLLELVSERDAISEQIATHVASSRRRVLAQYDVLFGPEAPQVT